MIYTEDDLKNEESIQKMKDNVTYKDRLLIHLNGKPVMFEPYIIPRLVPKDSPMIRNDIIEPNTITWISEKPLHIHMNGDNK